jgi:phage tail-like protein
MQAIPSDQRKTFRFLIEVDGLDLAHCRKANIPEVEVAPVEHAHAGAGHTIKTAGRRKVGDITLEKTMPADGADVWAWNWLNTEVRASDGTSKGAEVYKKIVTIIHLGNNDEPIQKWTATGCWPTKVSPSANDAMQEGEAFVESITLSVDDLEMVPV